jgi:hypothetical protein
MIILLQLVEKLHACCEHIVLTRFCVTDGLSYWLKGWLKGCLGGRWSIESLDDALFNN